MEKSIIINGKEYSEEQVSEAIQNFKEAWNTLIEIAADVVESLAESIRNIIEQIHEKNRKAEHVHDWYVPLKITPKIPQTDFSKLRITPNIRNNI